MNELMLNEIVKIIDESIQSFILEIKQDISVTNRSVLGDRTDFSIFRPANKEFFEYSTCEKFLEWKIRDYLVSDILCKLFNDKVISPNTEAVPMCKDNKRHPKTGYSNEEFGEDNLCAFIICTSTSRVGVRYSGYSYSNKEIRKIRKICKIDRIEVIDWSDTDSLESKWNRHISDGQSEFVRINTLRAFFSLYFSEAIYQIYISKIRDAVKEANNLIGFQTIPALSLRYISDFKSISIKQIKDLDFSNIQFHKFDEKGKVTSAVFGSLTKEDYQTINQVFFKESLYKSLIGTEEFARCFFTSEYLYSVYRTGVAINFDYTAVVVGYFKSVELLLYKIMKIWLEKELYKGLWIAAGNATLTNEQKYKFKSEPENSFFRRNPAKLASKKQVQFDKQYEELFSTEMGALIWFLYDNPNGWRITNHSREIVRICLWNYRKGCRNEYLHKEFLSYNNVDELECIRNNTLLCLYFLLGGCVITGDANEDKIVLGCSDNSYERLYKKLSTIPSSINCYIIQMEEDKQPVKTIRLSYPNTTEYDDEGNIITPIKFIEVTDFSKVLFDPSEIAVDTYKTITINHDIVPYKMWWYNKNKGQNEIVW